MKRIVVATLLSAYAALGSAGGPIPVTPESLQWVTASAIPGFQFAWVLGDGGKPGPYVLRAKLAARTTIAPHIHPDARHTTVLEGTLYVGFLETIDETVAVAIPAGTVYITPANTPHFVLAKDVDTTYQESGTGPTGTTLINP